MSTSDRGFGSMSKVRKTEVSSKGGLKAHKNGTAYVWTPEKAKAAAGKSAAARRRNCASKAALRLMKENPELTPQALMPLKLTLEEWVWYGGGHATVARVEELKRRVEASKATTA